MSVEGDRGTYYINNTEGGDFNNGCCIGEAGSMRLTAPYFYRVWFGDGIIYAEAGFQNN